MKYHSIIQNGDCTVGTNLISANSKKSIVGDGRHSCSFRTSYFDQINFFVYDPNVTPDISSSDFSACILVDCGRSALPCLLVFELNKRLVPQHISS